MPRLWFFTFIFSFLPFRCNVLANFTEIATPIIGISLRWHVNPDFIRGNRTVKFELHSSHIVHPSCVYTLGQNVECQHNDVPSVSTIASLFGVLCIAQVKVKDGIPQFLFMSRDGSKCLSDLNTSAWNLQGQGVSLSSQKIGRINQFKVLKNFLVATANESGHLQYANATYGLLEHEVEVLPEADGLLAWVPITELSASNTENIVSSQTFQCSLFPGGCSFWNEFRSGEPTVNPMTSSFIKLCEGIAFYNESCNSTSFFSFSSPPFDLPLIYSLSTMSTDGLDSQQAWSGKISLQSDYSIVGERGNVNIVYESTCFKYCLHCANVSQQDTQQTCPSYLNQQAALFDSCFGSINCNDQLRFTPTNFFTIMSVTKSFLHDIPYFIQGPDSDSWPTNTFQVCYFAENCEVLLYARDPQQKATSSNLRDISIELVMGSSSVESNDIMQPNGTKCVGKGTLFCVYTFPRTSSPLISHGAEFLRCFVAFALDYQNCENCKSAPLCVVVKLLPRLAWQILFQPPNVSLSQSSCSSETSIDIRFTGINLLNSESYEIQVSNSTSLQFYIVPEYLLKRTAEYVTILKKDLISGIWNTALNASRMFFRVGFKIGSQTLSSLPSETLNLYADPHLTSSFALLVAWNSQRLRVYKEYPNLQFREIAVEVWCDQVFESSIAFDSFTKSMYAVLNIEGNNGQWSVLSVNLESASILTQSLDVSSKSNIRNVQFYDTWRTLVAVDVRESGQSIVVFNLSSGETSMIRKLENSVRLHVSALSSGLGIYFLIETDDSILCFHMESNTTEVLDYRPKVGRKILGAKYDDDKCRLVLLESSWPDVNDFVTLTYIAFPSYAVTAQVTSLQSSFISHGGKFCMDFQRNLIVVVLPNRTVFEFFIDANHTVSHNIALDGNVVAAGVNEDKSPRIEAISSTEIFEKQFSVFIRGRNFGYRRMNQNVRMDGIDCSETFWRSNEDLTCFLPSFLLQSQAQLISYSVTVGSMQSPSVLASTIVHTWFQLEPVAAPIRYSSLKLTITGKGFVEPFKDYRCLFVGNEGSVMSKSPLSSTRGELVFMLPTWPFPAGPCSVHLCILGSDGVQNIVRQVVPVFDPKNQTFEFMESWESVLPTFQNTSFAFNSFDVVLVGVGFNAKRNYSCNFVSTAIPSNNLIVTGVAQSLRFLRCRFPGWPYQADNITFDVLYNDKSLIFRDGSAMESSSPIQSFQILESWISISPRSTYLMPSFNITVVSSAFRADAGLYTCSLLQSSLVSVGRLHVHNYSHLECIFFELGSMNLLYGEQIFQILLGSRLVQNFSTSGYRFLPVWYELSPSRGVASGGFLVTIHGDGLLASRNYHVELRCSDGIGFTQQYEIDCQSNTQLLFETKVWTFQSCVTALQIRTKNGELVEFLGDSKALYFMEHVVNISHATPLYADNVALHIDGAGLFAGKPYDLEVYRLGMKVKTVSAPALSEVSLTFSSFIWDNQAGAVTFIVKDQSTVLLNYSTQILEVCSTLEPTQFSAFGKSITVNGYGFNADNAYDLRFKQDSSTVLVDSAHITSQGVNQLVFNISDVLQAFHAGEVQVSLISNSESILFNSDSSFAIVTIQEVLPDVILSALATGDSIVLHGFGFMENVSYSCKFVLSEDVGQCIYLDTERLRCSIPPMPPTVNEFSYLQILRDSVPVSGLVAKVRPLAGLSDIFPKIGSSLLPQHVTVTGGGFDSPSTYMCRWECLDYSLETTAKVLNWTFVSCNEANWNFSACNANFSFWRNDVRMVPTFPFTLFGAVSTIEPATYLAGVPGDFAVHGAGFDVSRLEASYQCIRGNETSELVRAVSNVLLYCSLPAWKQAAGDVAITVKDVSRGIFLEGSVQVTYTMTIQSIEPSEGLASLSSHLVTVRGGGFSLENDYLLRVTRNSDVEDGVLATETRSHFELVFNIPAWKYSGGTASVSLVENGILRQDAGLLHFVIRAVFTSIRSFSGTVFGGILILNGVGWSDDAHYICSITAFDDSSMAVNSSDYFYSSPTIMEIRLGRWQYQATTVNVSLIENSHPVPGRDSLYLDMAWLDLKIAGIARQSAFDVLYPSFSGGELIEVIGGGFPANSSARFECRFTTSESLQSSFFTANPYLATVGRAESWGTVSCETPIWIFQNSEAFFSLWLLGNPSRRISQIYVSDGSTRVIFAGKPLLVKGNVNGPILGSNILTLHGQNFGFQDVTPKVRIGDTGCEYTRWISSNEILCKQPSKGSDVVSVDVIVSVVPFRFGSRSFAFTFDGPYTSSVSVGNIPAVARLSIVGSEFSYYDTSHSVRVQGTAAEITKWLSVTTVQMKVPSGPCLSCTVTLTVVPSSVISTLSTALSYDKAILQSCDVALLDPSRANISSMVPVYCLGKSDSLNQENPSNTQSRNDMRYVIVSDPSSIRSTVQARIGSTSAERTFWKSDTSLTLFLSAGHLQTSRMTLTLSDNMISSATEFFSYNLPSLSLLSVRNRAPTQSTIIRSHIQSARFWVSHTVESRIGGTGTESTEWTSYTCVKAHLTRTLASSKQVGVTIGIQVGTVSFAFSNDVPSLKSSSFKIDTGIKTNTNVPPEDYEVFSKITESCTEKLPNGEYNIVHCLFLTMQQADANTLTIGRSRITLEQLQMGLLHGTTWNLSRRARAVHS
eukprot:748287-Hanusia_phi.AAC.2